jgi:hypothetical protein
MKVHFSFNINSTIRQFVLIVVFVITSCSPKTSQSVLSKVELQSYLISEIELPLSISPLHQISGRTQGDSIEIFLPDIQTKTLLQIRLDKINGNGKVYQIPLDFIATDQSTFFSAGYLPSMDRFMILRDPRYSIYDYDSVFYLLEADGFKPLQMQFNKRFFKTNDGDSSKYTIKCLFAEPCVLGEHLFILTVPTRIKYGNKELRTKYKIPDILKISLKDGSIEEIFDVLEFDNLNSNFSYKEQAIYLSPDESNNKVIISYGNDFNLYELDPLTYKVEKKDHGMPQFKYLNDRKLFQLDSNVATILYGVLPVLVGNKMRLMKIGHFDSKKKIPSITFKEIYDSTEFFLFYDSNMKIEAFLEYSSLPLGRIFNLNGVNYCAGITEGNRLRLHSVEFYFSKMQGNFDSTMEGLVSWVSDFEEMAPFDFSKTGIPKNAKLLLMPLANCPSCVRSTFEYLVNNNASFKDDFYFVFSIEAMNIFGMHPSNYDLGSRNFKIISDEVYRNLLPNDMNDFTIVEIVDGKVIEKKTFRSEMLNRD